MLAINQRIAQLEAVINTAWEHPSVAHDWNNVSKVVVGYAIKHYGDLPEVINDVRRALDTKYEEIYIPFQQAQLQQAQQTQIQPAQTYLQTEPVLQSTPQSIPQPIPQPIPQQQQSPPPSHPRSIPKDFGQPSSGEISHVPPATAIDQMGRIIEQAWKAVLKLDPEGNDIVYLGSKTVSRWHQLFFDRNIAKVSFDKLVKAKKDLVHVNVNERVQIEQRSGHVVVTIEDPNWEPIYLTEVDSSGRTKWIRIGQPNHPAKQLDVPIGIDMDGNLVRLPLDTVLIGGMRGGGKSSLQKLIPAALMLENPPWNLKFLMIETVKGVGMNGFRDTPWSWNGLNGVLDGVVNNPEVALETIANDLKEFEERRYEQLRRVGVESIEEYNELMDNPRTLDQYVKTPVNRRPMYRLIVNIEEIAALVDLYGDRFNGALISRTEQSRAAGILWVLGTQRPEPGVIHTRVGQNMAARIAVMCGTQKNYHVVLGTVGSREPVPELQGQGEAILRYRGQNKRIQTLLADKNLIRNIVEKGKQKYGLLNEGLV